MITPSQVILIYGAGGIGKSSRIAEAAAYTYRTTGKTTRVVNADGGGTASALEVLKDEGIVEIWDIDQWAGIFTNLNLATLGWWPEDVNTPNSRLLPPFRLWLKCIFCQKDSGSKDGLSMVKACAECKKEFPAGTRLPVEQELLNGIDKVGLVAFEGMTSFGDILLNRFKDLDKSGAANVVKEGDYSIVQVGMQHYLLAQNELMKLFRNMRAIPVDLIMWTALELKSDEDGKPIYGPQGPGKKLTGLCIPKFTSVIHIDAVAKRDPKGGVMKNPDGTEVLDRKMFLAPHFPADNPGQKFVAKTSAPFGGDMPNVIDTDMALFFEEMKKAKEKVRAKLKGEVSGTGSYQA